MSAEQTPLNTVRARLMAMSGRKYWRSLEDAAETPEFQEYLHREFPANASEWLDPVGRRSFLKLMGASLALAGATACTVQPDELIVPYVRQPEETIPGRPLFFATAMTLGGEAIGLLVESHDGRPTKVEGNPEHPGSRGATDLYAQASVLTLYDPDRSQGITELGEIRPWSGFVAAIRAALSAQAGTQGAGLRILTETVNSPTLAWQLQQVLAQYPQAKWIQWEPLGHDGARNGARAAFGEFVQPVFDLTKANVIVALDADFLSAERGSNLHYARQFASRRRTEGNPDNLNRLYVAESGMTVTGGKADHRVPLKSSHVEAFARAIASRLGVNGAGAAAPPAGTDAYVDAIAKDLQANRGASAVIAGDAQPAAVHALAAAINDALGNAGQTVTYLPTPEAVPSDQHASLRELVTDMEAGRVQSLLIVGEANPVLTAPADLKFADALGKVANRFHSGLFHDETAQLCHWHVPAAHYLEAWSDARAFDGTAAIVQPLIQPMYGGRSAHEVIGTLSDRPERPGYEVVREFWSTGASSALRPATGGAVSAAASAAPVTTAGQPPAAQAGNQRQGANNAAPTPTPTGQGAVTPANVQEQRSTLPATAPASAGTPAVAAGGDPRATFEREWRRWLHDGIIPRTAHQPRPVALAGDWASRLPAGSPVDGIEINFRHDPTIYDGRFANNGWLQELPKPMTKLTWDNAALVAPATAEKLGVENGDLLEIRHDGRMLRLPAWVLPGHALDAVTLYVGYGRTRAGRVGNGTGFNAYALQGSASPWFGAAELAATGDSYDLVSTQDHWALEDRNIIRSSKLEEFKADPTFAQKMEHLKLDKPISLYPDYEYKGYAWGMAIDLNTCTGCSACVIACQAENNIPVVGKSQVKVNREMHWLRVDRYYAGELDNPDTYFSPMPCMQCEAAPCEVVCPVAATVHSDEGLNDMVYNRCVGTRYCSNNCPYKVRRFNFLLYADWNTASYKMQRNPDVTVRSRGVMEKCTFCVQRINAARIQAKREDRDIRDGEVLTACQAVCPTDAIVFGNINDPNSRVAQLKASPRNYAMLAELNTRPRTTFLAAVRNPNPALPSNPTVGGHHATSESHESSEQH